MTNQGPPGQGDLPSKLHIQHWLMTDERVIDHAAYQNVSLSNDGKGTRPFSNGCTASGRGDIQRDDITYRRGSFSAIFYSFFLRETVSKPHHRLRKRSVVSTRWTWWSLQPIWYATLVCYPSLGYAVLYAGLSGSLRSHL